MNKKYDIPDTLMRYDVTSIKYPTAEYILGKKVPVFDEGGHYRIDNSHIFDKFKIKEIVHEGDTITLKMRDEEVVLTVCEKENK
ncbi:MAG: hypothetical protein IJQ53_00440 [Clostridia bacterium]|nr:hypothetical protein [Clostridia bacterium]